MVFIASFIALALRTLRRRAAICLVAVLAAARHEIREFLRGGQELGIGRDRGDTLRRAEFVGHRADARIRSVGDGSDGRGGGHNGEKKPGRGIVHNELGTKSA